MPRRERPLDQEDSVLLRFAADLRRLREQAGSPTYRALSKRAHYSPAALSEAAGGRKLPSLAVTLAFVMACDGDASMWEARWREIAAEPNGNHGRDAVDPPAPYVGLAAFQPNDADRFFGRGILISELQTQVRRRRLVGVFGASGSGKSSLLRAGLVGRVDMPGVVFTPGAQPLEECAVHLAALTGGSAASWRDDLAADPANLYLRIRQAMVQDEDDLLLVVDQFEEVFTLCGEEERDWFISALTIAAGADTSRVRIVLGVRADFYGHCGQHPQLVDALRGAHILISPMTPDELREAITAPALHAGHKVQTALVARLVAEATGQPAVLPLVSHALLETWRRRHGITLTLSGYEAAGGIQHAVARTAENVYRTLDRDQQTIVRRLFLRLIAIGEATEDTKRRVSTHELDDDPGTAFVLEHLTEARLVVVDHGGVEMVHEALIRHWPRLQDWLAEDRDGLRIHRHFTEAAANWETLNRDPDALYRGIRLARAREWTTTRNATLARQERQFLDASIAAESREHATTRRRARRLRRLVVLLAVLLTLATFATIYAVDAQQTASAQRDNALAHKVIQEAMALRATNPALAMQLTLAAYRLTPTTATRSSVLGLFTTPYASRLTGYLTGVFAVDFRPDGAVLAAASINGTRLWDVTDQHRPRELGYLPINASSVSFSPDGRWLATAMGVAGVQLWDVSKPDSPQKVFAADDGILHNAGTATSVTFSPDGRILAVSGTDRSTKLWDVDDPRSPSLMATLSLPGDPDTGSTSDRRIRRPAPPPGVSELSPTPNTGAAVAFNRDGRVLATVSHEQTARLWNVADPRHPVLLSAITSNKVAALEFSPDGRILATTSTDATTRLWDLTDPRKPTELSILTGHTAAVFTVAFSPDGHTVATGSKDRTTRLWDVTDPRKPTELGVLTGHTDAVLAVAFSRNGRTVATGSIDKTARLTDISQFFLASHTESVTSVVFSRDGRTMATASADTTARLWSVTNRYQPQRLATLHTGTELVSVALSPNGHTLVTTDIDGTTRFWDIRDPNGPREVSTLTSLRLSTAGFSPDGRFVAATGRDGPQQPWQASSQLWDVGDPHRPTSIATLQGASAALLTFSPDGRTLASASGLAIAGDWIQLWDVAEPHHPRRTTRIPTGAFSVIFSPDSRTLATTNHEGTTQLWDVTNAHHTEALATLPGKSDIDSPRGQPVTFQPDGRTLAVVGDDRTVRLWDITDPRHPVEIATVGGGDAASIRAIASSPDAGTLATAGDDHVVRLWETSVDRLATHICHIAHPRITRSEWDHHFPGLDYQPPCP